MRRAGTMPEQQYGNWEKCIRIIAQSVGQLCEPMPKVLKAIQLCIQIRRAFGPRACRDPLFCPSLDGKTVSLPYCIWTPGVLGCWCPCVNVPWAPFGRSSARFFSICWRPRTTSNFAPSSGPHVCRFWSDDGYMLDNCCLMFASLIWVSIQHRLYIDC